ncbi:AP2 domain [Burkholderia pseudomallei]|nr:AP2 domain [Burkholderia pseudomallei]
MGKTSKHVGVSWNSAMSKWAAQVRLNLKLNHLGFFLDNKYRVTIGAKYLGYFDTIDEAIRARKSAEERNGYHVNHGRK